MPEGDILQLDIVAIMDVGDIDTYLLVLLCLHTLRECHSLSLHLAEGVEGGYGLHALVGRHDSGETTIRIVFELLDSYTTAKAATIGQLAGVVEEIAVTFVVGHTTVVGKRLRIGQRHNLASILPRTRGVRCRTVADMLRNTTRSIQQVVFTSLAFQVPLAFRRGVRGEASLH